MKFFRYKDIHHDIKLQVTGIDDNGRVTFKPVAGLNDFSKRWFNSYGKTMTPSSDWLDIIPYKNNSDSKHSFICTDPKNKPGQKL